MKPSISISFLFCITFFSAIRLPAQSPCDEWPLPQEQVVVHLDRNVCLAGETIWLKAWCLLDGQLEQEMSKVLYVELFDETQKVIVQEKFLLNNNRVAGSIRIPEDVPTKYYFLKAYTRYMRNFSSSAFHYQPLIIVNPFIEGGSIQVTETNSDNSQEPVPADPSTRTITENRLQIDLDKKQYQSREKIDFQIKSMQALSAELSVTVRLRGLGHQPAQQIMRQNQWLQASCLEDPYCRQFFGAENLSGDPSATFPPDSDSLQWLPETRGLTISGLVQNEQQETVAGASLMVAVLQEAPMLYLGTTNEQGRFTIPLHDMQHQQELFVGTPDENNQVLIQNDFDADLPEIATVPLQFDSSLHRLFESLHLHQQLNRIYPEPVTRVVFQPKPPAIAATNLLSPDRRIVLSDFIELSTMSEVFNEITAGVVLRKEGLSVFNPEQQKWYESPLILLDNVPVYDIEELLKIDPAKVEAIEIYHSDYMLGDYIIGAIISIISQTDNFAGYQWGSQVAFAPFKTFTMPQAFVQVIPPEKGHFPDFRPVLYWQPDLQLKQQQESEPLSVFAPDQPGVYEVLVQGYTPSGEACTGYVTFEVISDR